MLLIFLFSCHCVCICCDTSTHVWKQYTAHVHVKSQCVWINSEYTKIELLLEKKKSQRQTSNSNRLKHAKLEIVRINFQTHGKDIELWKRFRRVPNISRFPYSSTSARNIPWISEFFFRCSTLIMIFDDEWSSEKKGFFSFEMYHFFKIIDWCRCQKWQHWIVFVRMSLLYLEKLIQKKCFLLKLASCSAKFLSKLSLHKNHPLVIRFSSFFLIFSFYSQSWFVWKKL